MPKSLKLPLFISLVTPIIGYLFIRGAIHSGLIDDTFIDFFIENSFRLIVVSAILMGVPLLWKANQRGKDE
jgi:hypothetical protein